MNATKWGLGISLLIGVVFLLLLSVNAQDDFLVKTPPQAIRNSQPVDSFFQEALTDKPQQAASKENCCTDQSILEGIDSFNEE